MLALYWKFERYVIVLVLLMSLSAEFVHGQDSLKTDTRKPITMQMDSLGQDTTSVVVLKHSPTKAALLSAAFPGFGQIYNRKFWKLPIIYAGIGISAYYLIKNQKLYKDYYEGLVNYSNTNNVKSVQHLDLINKPYITETGRINEALVFYVDVFRRYRDWSFVFLAGTYVLNIVDAAVDAYLFDYDISDDLTVRVQPIMTNTIANRSAFGLKLSFNLH